MMANNPPTTAQTPQTANNRRWVVYCLCLVALSVITVLNVIFYYQEGVAVFLYILSCFSIGGGVYAWCVYDGKLRGFRLSKNMRMALCYIQPIAVPVYFVRSRGLTAAAKAGFGLFLYIPFYALYYAIWFITVHLLMAVGYYAQP